MGEEGCVRMKQGATGKMHPHTQAELVDGFLAWDFDADTAATFFAQQVKVYSGAFVDAWYTSCS